MKKVQKAVIVVLSILMLMALTVAGTLAYLTDKTEVVENTFSVGHVTIDLDEAPTDELGVKTQAYENATSEAEKLALRVKENHYQMFPGRSYFKDPKVWVMPGSQASYIRAKVTVSDWSDLAEILEKYGYEFFVDMTNYSNEKYIIAYDGEFWHMEAGQPTIDVAKNTATFVMRYYYSFNSTYVVPAVSATSSKYGLDPIFYYVDIPAELRNEDVAKLEQFQIDIVAEAIQADGFETVDDAWAGFAQYPPTENATGN